MEDAPSFLQSRPWERLQQRLGHATYWLDDVLWLERPLKWGLRYWYAPRAPRAPDLTRLDAAFKQRAMFVRLEPTGDQLAEPWRTAPSIQPRQTLLTDLTPSADDLLAGFKPKTRYNIKLAERKGVTVVRYPHPESLSRVEEWLALTRETNLRDQISSHPPGYYATLLDELGKEGMASLFIAYLDQQPLSALILVRHQQTATYLFGASASRRREAMAPYLLQWSAMQAAKTDGVKIYDWWGVKTVPRFARGELGATGQPEQVMAAPGRTFGVTRFKLGFGGLLHFYPPAGDRIYQPFWYNIYRRYQSRRSSGGFAY